MARKQWTPQMEITDSLLKFREKRKWQLAYRRYVLEKSPSESYAPYFGLDIETLREWFELQFTSDLTWESFGKTWQFDHIIPTTYFDYSIEEDRILCWSFVNMRVEMLQPDKNRGDRIDLLAVRAYFQDLYNRTEFTLYQRMLEKIAAIEASNIEDHPAVENFIIENKALLEGIASLDHGEFNRLNKGTTLKDVLLEREILRKFGSGQKP